MVITPSMNKRVFTSILLVFLFLCGCRSEAPAQKGTESAADGPVNHYQALKDHSVVTIHGTGTTEAVLVTDPMCNHCRIAHLFLHDNRQLFGTLHLVFMPRESYPGSDMAAWIAEDLADSSHLQGVLDFLFEMLHRPASKDPEEARMDVLDQFLKAYSVASDTVTPQELRERLGKEHGEHAAKGTELVRQADLPGTPILMTPDETVKGFSPGHWTEVLSGKKMEEVSPKSRDTSAGG